MLLLLLPPHPSLLPGGSAVSAPRRLRARAVRMEPDEGGQAAVFDDLGEKQVYGPTKPAHAWPKPWTNLETQEHVQVVKAASGLLQEPLRTDMGDDEIFVGKDSIHILKHHGSYMQQDRSLKGKDKQHSYQFMLRLKMPCGEVPPSLAAVFKSCSPSLSPPLSLSRCLLTARLPPLILPLACRSFTQSTLPTPFGEGGAICPPACTGRCTLNAEPAPACLQLRGSPGPRPIPSCVWRSLPDCDRTPPRCRALSMPSWTTSATSGGTATYARRRGRNEREEKRR